MSTEYEVYMKRYENKSNAELIAALAALHASEGQFRVLLETMTEGVVLIASSGQITYANHAAELILGLRRDAIEGRNYLSPDWEISRPDGSPMPPEEMAGPRAMKESLPVKNVLMGVRRPDDAVSWIDVSASPLFGDDGGLKGVVGTFTDVTEWKKAGEELRNAQKLESLGILADGIAHDFNNLLGALFGYVDLAREPGCKPEKRKKYLDGAMKALVRAKDLTQRLLAFSNSGGPAIKPCSISTIIDEAALAALSGGNVRPAVEIAKDRCCVMGDEGQLYQVFSNILLNARQAMPGGGAVEISAANIELAADAVPLMPEGKYVRIVIKDHGTGIAQKYLSRLFEPFFSTKPAGHGLGLSIAHSIVKKHNGHIRVESRLGVGTTVTIYLPACNAGVSAGQPPASGNFHGTGKILIMDDEEFIRDSLSEMLAELGYETHSTRDGDEAITAYRDALKSGKKFDGVVFDLTIPAGKGGRETIAELQRLTPEITAIVSSGYSDDPVMTNPKQYGFKAAVAKPFTIGKISKVLHDVLKGQSAVKE